MQQASVVDVASPFRESKPGPPARLYDLRYPDHGSGSSTTVRVSCSGGGPDTHEKRSCFTTTSYDTPYRYRGVLSVYYMLQQPYSAGAQQATPPATAEGELMLAFDMRIRAWIDSMMKKP